MNVNPVGGSQPHAADTHGPVQRVFRQGETGGFFRCECQNLLV